MKNIFTRSLLRASQVSLGIVIGVSLFLVPFTYRVRLAEGATNIDSGANNHWAWNDVFGWIDFYNTNSVTVKANKIEGYASSSAGYLSLDCATAPSGDICLSSNYGVVNNGVGALSGYAWNDTYGWFSFDCHDLGVCGTANYRVLINGTTGDFNNYAWNDLVGWVSFNCSDIGVCGASNYKVNTAWRATSTSAFVESETFDTGLASGSQLYSFLWQGTLPLNTSVKFQFAASNSSSGPWNYKGTDGTSNTYYTPTPGSSTMLDYSYFNAARFYRYKVTLVSDQAQTVTPQIDDVFIQWAK
jgi:hypothetical protein